MENTPEIPPTDNLVDPAFACPKCGERDADKLVLSGDDEKDDECTCQTCHLIYPI